MIQWTELPACIMRGSEILSMALPLLRTYVAGVQDSIYALQASHAAHGTCLELCTERS